MASFTKNFTIIAAQRIEYDMKIYYSNKSQLERSNIYLNFKLKDTEVTSQYSLLIVGPSDSPFEGGFYYFNADYPDLYPYYSMRLTLLNGGSNKKLVSSIKNNDICSYDFLSNNGPNKWMPCMSSVSIAEKIRNSLINKVSDLELSNSDIDIIKYCNLLSFVCDIMYNKPLEFKELLEKEFMSRYNYYLSTTEYFKTLHNITLLSDKLDISVTINYSELKNKIVYIYNSLSQSKTTHNDASSNSISLNNVNKKKLVIKKKSSIQAPLDIINNQEPISTLITNNIGSELVDQNISITDPGDNDKHKSTRKVPSKLASKYDVGYRLKSENDNCMYEIQELIISGKKTKKWIKISE